MIKDALEFLKKAFYNPPDSVELEGRKYLRNPSAYEEVRAPQVVEQAFRNWDGAPLRFGTVAALSDFINQHKERTCQILITRKQAEAYFDIEKSYQVRDFINGVHVFVPFSSEYTKFETNYLGFMDLLDQWGEDCEDVEAIRNACRSLRLVDQSTLKVTERGPVISIETASSKDLEGGTVSLPKEIVVNLPVGTREFKVPCVFLLRVLTANGMQFILTRKMNDGAWDLMLEQALAYLKEHNPDVFVTEGK